MKKFLTALLAALTLLCSLSLAPALADPDEEIIYDPVYKLQENGTLDPASVNAQAAICVDAQTGAVLYEVDSHRKMYPASITKVMTFLLVLEYVENSAQGMDEVITVDKPYKLEDGAVEIYLRAGEEFTMEQLIYALMLKSANDVAILLAEHIGGSVSGFADMMNARAQQLGMEDTHFVNPHGLHDEDHYTTAYDMSLLMREAIRHEGFGEVVSTLRYTIPETNKTDEPRSLSNSNRLLKESEDEYYEYCLGGKTGYTSKARNTFVCYGEKDGRTVVAVVLHSPLSSVRFLSAKHMLRYGLEAFENISLHELFAPLEYTARVSGSSEVPDGILELPVTQRAQQEVTVTGRTGKLTAEDYDPRVQWREELTAPIAAGEVLGTVSYYYKNSDEPSLVCDLIASRDVASPTEPATTAAPTTAAGEAPAVTLPQRPSGGSGDHSITAWLTAALIILILLIVTVAFMLFHSGSRQRREDPPAQPTGRGSRRSAPADAPYRSDRRSTGRRSSTRSQGRHGRLR